MTTETQPDPAPAPAPLIFECCGTCRFARPAYRVTYGGGGELIDEDRRECHRYAPTRGPWPSLIATEWCGDFAYPLIPGVSNVIGEDHGTETGAAPEAQPGAAKSKRAAGKG